MAGGRRGFWCHRKTNNRIDNQTVFLSFWLALGQWSARLTNVNPIPNEVTCLCYSFFSCPARDFVFPGIHSCFSFYLQRLSLVVWTFSRSLQTVRFATIRKSQGEPTRGFDWTAASGAVQTVWLMGDLLLWSHSFSLTLFCPAHPILSLLFGRERPLGPSEQTEKLCRFLDVKIQFLALNTFWMCIQFRIAVSLNVCTYGRIHG